MRRKSSKQETRGGPKIPPGDLVGKPAERPKYRLHELLRQVTSKNIHAEVNTESPAGREVW